MGSRRGGQSELRIYQPEWREMVLLLAGVLHHHGHRRVDRMFATILDQLPENASLAQQARCAALLGAAVQDLAPLKYKPSDPRYQKLFDAVFGLFTGDGSAKVPIRVAIEAAEALGQAGDPRLSGAAREKNWIPIEGGEFRMGAQKGNPRGDNYDREAGGDEGPVHVVRLDAFQIARYPVTVAEFARFVAQDGYEDERWRPAGGFGDVSEPEQWDEQLQYPNRPVVRVSWYEAAAYAAWAGCQLPTEAQWERAARGTEGRKYAWGNQKPDERRMNYDTNIGSPTPVGIYPLGSTPEGICDMSGNVWEWCADWYDERFYASSPVDNPCCDTAGSFRVLRGGSWYGNAWFCRGACRNDYGPANRSYGVGFRLVRSG